MEVEAVLAGGVILQVAFALLTDRQRREMLQTSAPVTACLLVLYGLAAAAFAGSGARVLDVALPAESTALLAEPWRVLSCMVVYERTTALAIHLWLLLKLAPQLEAKIGSRSFAFLHAFSCAVAVALRSALLNPEQRPGLLTAAPLFATLIIWGQLTQNAGGAVPPRYLAWLLLLSLVLLEGATAALPGLLGCGAAAMYQAMFGLPRAIAPPPPPPAAPPAEPSSTSASTSAAAVAGSAAGPAPTVGETGEAAAAADGVDGRSRMARILQFLALVYLIGSLTLIDTASNGEEAL